MRKAEYGYESENSNKGNGLGRGGLFERAVALADQAKKLSEPLSSNIV